MKTRYLTRRNVAELNQETLRYVILTSLFIPLVYKLSNIPLSIAGNDTQTHVYKIEILSSQIKAGLPLASIGVYDWSWYAGYEFLQVYAPLFYWISSALNLLGLTPTQAAIATTVGSFVVGGVGTWLIIEEYTNSLISPAVGTVAFLYVPSHLTNFLQFGGLPRTLAVGLAPLAILWMMKYLDSRNDRYFVLWILSGVAVTISNYGVGFVITLASIIYLFLSREYVLSVVYGAWITLCSLFSLLPYATYNIANDLPVFVPVSDTLNFIRYLLIDPSGLGLVFMIGFQAVLLIVYIQKSDYPKRGFRTGLVAIFFVLFNVFALMTSWDLIEIAAYQRSTPAILVFGSVSLGLLVDELEMRHLKRTFLIMFILLLAFEGIGVDHYEPIQDDKYQSGFEAIREDSDSWSRWMFIPRLPVGATAVDDVGKPSMSGWYVQGMNEQTYSQLGTTMSPQLLQLEPELAYGDTSTQLEILEYMGVEYVLVEKSAPPLSYRMSNDIYESVSASGSTTEIHHHESAYVYKFESFNSIESYEEKPETRTEFIRDDQPATVHSVTQTQTKFDAVFEVQQSRWVVIPVAHTDSLVVTLNGESVDTETAFGGMTLLQVEPGVHHVEAAAKIPIVEIFAIVLSIVSILSLLTFGSEPHNWLVSRVSSVYRSEFGSPTESD